MTILFEHYNWERTKRSASLRGSLQDVWASRSGDLRIDEEEITEPVTQPFLTFDGDKIKARNFVGFIQDEDEIVEIYPKVFRACENIKDQKELMLRHIFFWFDYCRKWKFPFTQSTLETAEIDSFPELIINLIARQFFDSVCSQPLHLYQTVEESLRSPRGSLNFTRYVGKSLATGNLHVLECDHEPFLYDNKVNRIIKYCSRLLMAQTRVAENLRVLQDVIFILDDVDDSVFTVGHIDSCSINPFFDAYNGCLESCRLILSNQLYSSALNDLSQWCLLFPMEYIFEDFIAGFIDDRFGKDWKVEYQKSDKYLVHEPSRAFRMQHDIFLTSRSDPKRSVIVDTKYKLRDPGYKSDPKRGVSQQDLYQMLSYAYKRGCSEVLLLYPNVSEVLNEPDRFTILSGFESCPEVNVTTAEIPFWSIDNFQNLESLLHSEIGRVLSLY